MMIQKSISKILYCFGLILLVVSFILGTLVFSKTISLPFFSMQTICIPFACGFFLLIPQTYIEADEMRKKKGEIDFIFISYCGKYLFFGFFFIFAFFLGLIFNK
jgi:hypothetical protein